MDSVFGSSVFQDLSSTGKTVSDCWHRFDALVSAVLGTEGRILIGGDFYARVQTPEENRFLKWRRERDGTAVKWKYFLGTLDNTSHLRAMSDFEGLSEKPFFALWDARVSDKDGDNVGSSIGIHRARPLRCFY